MRACNNGHTFKAPPAVSGTQWDHAPGLDKLQDHTPVMATDIMSAPHFRTPPCTPPIIENRRPKEAAALAAACASGDLEDAKRILGTYLLGTLPELCSAQVLASAPHGAGQKSY